MKRKLLLILLSVACIFCLAFGLAACVEVGGNGNQNSTQGGSQTPDPDSQGGGKTEHTHSLSLVGAEDPTCTKDGNTAYYTCTVCKKWFADEDGKGEITDKTSVVVKK